VFIYQEGAEYVVVTRNNRIISTYHSALNNSNWIPKWKSNSVSLLSQVKSSHISYLTAIESEFYITTDDQSTSLSWNEAPNWALKSDLYYCQTVVGLLMWGSLSLTRGRVYGLQLLLEIDSAVILGSKSHGTRDHILLSQTRDFPFRCLLRLARIWWRYSTQPPRGIDFWGRVTLRLAVYRQSVRLGAEPLKTHGQNCYSSIEHQRS
jgi:hypothetical protein